MNMETFQVPVLTAAVIALAALFLIPAAAMAMSKLPPEVLVKNADTSEGPACNLPPTVKLDGRGDKAAPTEVPSLDKKVTEDYKTATFSMG